MIHFTIQRCLAVVLFLSGLSLPAANPIITNVFTADPAAPKITGPWTPRGLLAEFAGNCNTMHQAIIDFKGRSYFIYHNGGVQPGGGSFRRSVCIDYLNYNADGTIQRIIQTTEGVSQAK